MKVSYPDVVSYPFGNIIYSYFVASFCNLHDLFFLDVIVIQFTVSNARWLLYEVYYRMWQSLLTCLCMLSLFSMISILLLWETVGKNTNKEVPEDHFAEIKTFHFHHKLSRNSPPLCPKSLCHYSRVEGISELNFAIDCGAIHLPMPAWHTN